MLRNWRWGAGSSRVLDASHTSEILAVLRREPLTSMLAVPFVGRMGGGSVFLGADRPGGELAGLVWSGSNVVPAGDLDAMDAIIPALQRRGRRCTSIVGRADLVLRIWDGVQGRWGKAREVRDDQPCLVTRAAPLVEGDPRVRRATASDFPILLPAAVAMFTEEVGYDPTRVGGGYALYVEGLATAGRSYIITDRIGGRETVIFKADIGSLWEGIAQIQGVWTHPALRGQGLATAGMAAAVEQIRAQVAPVVSLYVNAFNHSARRVYEKVGFIQEATYATVLF